MPLKKRILISPLDWGLGHATRCIPIIQLLLKKNAEVLIAGSGRSLDLLKKEFPNLTFIDLPGYDIQYSKGSLAWKLFLSTPKIFKAIQKEHDRLEKIIRERKIDIVISDNRFGLWSKQVKTIFITHQLRIKSPIGERLLYRINLHYIKKFTECWIPDRPGPANLSGDLSHPYPLPPTAFFIGLLSRFSTPVDSLAVTARLKKSYDVMIIVSGPEPQRSAFEALVLRQAQQVPLQFLLVRGMPENDETIEVVNNVDVFSHLDMQNMQAALLRSAIIISRSGYSTLMDLTFLGKKAIFIPTPGQTEQQYLAYICMQKKLAYSEKQAGFDLNRALKEAHHFNGFQKMQENYLEEKLDLFLAS